MSNKIDNLGQQKIVTRRFKLTSLLCSGQGQHLSSQEMAYVIVITLRVKRYRKPQWLRNVINYHRNTVHSRVHPSGIRTYIVGYCYWTQEFPLNFMNKLERAKETSMVFLHPQVSGETYIFFGLDYFSSTFCHSKWGRPNRSIQFAAVFLFKY